MEWAQLLTALDATGLSWAGRASAIAVAFWTNENVPDSETILSSLEENAIKFPVETNLCATRIVRKYDPLSAAKIAGRLVAYAPASHTLRYTLADCLVQSPFVEDQLEAMKQQLLARGLHIEQLLAEPNGVIQAEEIRTRHVQRLQQFLADSETPSTATSKARAIAKMARRAAKIPPSTVQRLLALPDRARLPPVDRPSAAVRVVVDTNAITHRATHALLKDWRAEHLAPESVLMEIAAHGRIEFIPWGFHYVKIRPDSPRVPPEIQTMFSRRKGRAPSRADKMVATLAYHMEADAILTDDKDIWDTSIRYDIMKNTGREIDIVRPDQYARWLQRRVGGTAPR